MSHWIRWVAAPPVMTSSLIRHLDLMKIKIQPAMAQGRTFISNARWGLTAWRAGRRRTIGLTIVAVAATISVAVTFTVIL
jgi:hypothetical protein